MSRNGIVVAVAVATAVAFVIGLTLFPPVREAAAFPAAHLPPGEYEVEQETRQGHNDPAPIADPLPPRDAHADNVGFFVNDPYTEWFPAERHPPADDCYEAAWVDWFEMMLFIYGPDENGEYTYQEVWTSPTTGHLVTFTGKIRPKP